MGFALLVLLVLYILLSVYIYRFVCRKTGNRKIRILTIVILFLLATWDNILGLTTFYYLCWTQGGEKIYRTVENTEGYLDVGVRRYGGIGEYYDLIEGNYKFIEVEVKRDASDEERTRRYFRGKQPVRLPNGKYRYYLDKAGSPNCRYFYEDKARHLPNDRYYSNFPQGYCMATESVNTFKSRYAYRFLLDEDRDKYAILNIRKLESSVRDIRSGEILGEVRTFSYHGGWIATRMYGFSLLRCPVPDPDPKVNSAHINLLHDVLKPIQP